MLDRLTQDTRLLRLTTPQGAAQLLVECVRGEEAIGKPFAFDISTLSTDAAIPLKSLLGQPAILELVTAASKEAPRPFHGHITAIELSGSNGGLARYTVRLEPWTAFLAQNRDSRVFQDLSVCDILDAVLGSWQGQGKLVPEWRFELADRAAYPKRSLCTQYQESDWAFAERLMAEEGLFYYFEHRSDGHLLVIADHNGAFQPNEQAAVRFTQAGAVMREDSMDRWRMQASLLTSEVALQSWDYRTLDQRAASAASADDGGIPLSARDVPGAYAYSGREHGQRLAERRLQAVDVARKNMTGAGTVRTMAPATRFSLQGEPVTGDSGDFIVIRVLHLMHNNLAAQMRSNIQRELGQAALQLLNDGDLAESRHAVGNAIAERPLYRNRIDAIEAALPYRSGAPWKRPTVQGQQTAIVVGPSGAPIHTDRDHRVKVQFHWQRGDSSHSRLAPSLQAGDSGAPADDSAGTWVRVATPLAPIAGANWGSNTLPRVGQEVLVDFLEGDIDRPVIIGALYNGDGQADAQHNKIGAGTGAATGNAPVWFPGESGGHAHPASLSGLKSQAMQSSQAGAGAYSQLVFDDSPGQSRVALQRHAKPHQGTAELNLGHLRHQSDNQRLHAVGFGAELKTEHALALRSGQGMLLSTHAARGASGNVLDARPAQNQVESARQLQIALAEQAKTHKANLPKQEEADKLPVTEGLQRTADTLSSRANSGAPAFDAPLLQVDSPSGIVAATPADALLASETSSSVTASQDINFAAQANLLHSSAGGISLFTYGKADAKDKPNQETGLHLHAASGKYSSQSQDAATMLTADKAVAVASINAEVNIAAKQHVLLTTQGAAIRIEGGNITLNAPGKVEFKASMKELGGPSDGSIGLPNLPKLAVTNYPEKYSNRLDVHDLFIQHELAGITYAAKRTDGKVVRGLLDQHGRTDQLYVKDKEKIEVLVGPKQTEWGLIYDYDDE
ncbi:type VI secretion system Vgr family protein [Duganella sp. Root198D2]|uniref:type VI secretion system Vgr family protein n=1 Tax=Duganella sp. Root198D2 TaxID=1736489 RepID=UPI00070CCF0F|nr:type VI secretion system Vgr family protein [Duganella sp. Root198D2]KRB93659.1 type VI secretion protein [Duganella sp. Root198D2]